MRISTADASRFLVDHVPAADAAIRAADANGNGNLTRAEAKSLDAPFQDTFEHYKEAGRTVRTDDFAKFYAQHAKVSALSGYLAGDLVNNFQLWRAQPNLALTNAERANIVWDHMSAWGPTDGSARMVTASTVPDLVKEWIDEAQAQVIASDDRLFDIFEMYEVPVSTDDSRVAGYAILGYGNNDAETVAYQSCHVFSPGGALLDSDLDSISI